MSAVSNEAQVQAIIALMERVGVNTNVVNHRSLACDVLRALRSLPSEEGAWVAYYSDWSGAAVFDDELEAYRYGNPKTMSVVFVPYGMDLREAVQRR